MKLTYSEVNELATALRQELDGAIVARGFADTDEECFRQQARIEFLTLAHKRDRSA